MGLLVDFVYVDCCNGSGHVDFSLRGVSDHNDFVEDFGVFVESNGEVRCCFYGLRPEADIRDDQRRTFGC